jgi:hypothetical protein
MLATDTGDRVERTSTANMTAESRPRSIGRINLAIRDCPVGELPVGKAFAHAGSAHDGRRATTIAAPHRHSTPTATQETPNPFREPYSATPIARTPAEPRSRLKGNTRCHSRSSPATKAAAHGGERHRPVHNSTEAMNPIDDAQAITVARRAVLNMELVELLCTLSGTNDIDLPRFPPFQATR